MKFTSTLRSGTLIKRYKRFLADIHTQDGETITIHCPNTGAMTGCAEAGNVVWYSTSDNAKRKYPNTWEVSQNKQGHWFCINTTKANHVVKEAIEGNLITELEGYGTLKTEVKYGEENSRIDILLQSEGKPDCYIEVKSVTLLGENGQGYFPDAVSTRAQKHVRELMNMKQSGHRAILFFLVQHTGIDTMSPAHHIDAKYGELVQQAVETGVEILCYRTAMSPEQIIIDCGIKFTF